MKMPAAFRHPMLCLVVALPAAAVVAGVTTLVLAMGHPGSAGDARVRRVAQSQTADLAPDLEAARLTLRGEAEVDRNGAVSLRFGEVAPREPVLQLVLRHAAEPSRDRATKLVRASEGAYLGRLDAPRAAGAYNAELTPQDGAWRLVGRFDPVDAAFELRPALVPE